MKKKQQIDQETNSCEVCRSASHKYKCPSCNTKYCSLCCFKKHKDEICERETNRRKEQKDKIETSSREETDLKKDAEEGEITDNSSGEESDDEDRVSRHLLEKLGLSQELHGMLQNKHLREMMKEIDSSEDPGKILVKAMQIPIFTEFVDECLRIVDEDELEMEH